jgi:hypothetical protein
MGTNKNLWDQLMFHSAINNFTLLLVHVGMYGFNHSLGTPAKQHKTNSKEVTFGIIPQLKESSQPDT